MSLIAPKGSPSSPVWVLIDKTMSGDIDKGFVFSSPTGYVFDKMMRDAGFSDYYVIARKSDADDPDMETKWLNALQYYKPPIIIPLGSAGKGLLRELEPKKKRPNSTRDDSEISKYSGSILTASAQQLNWPHYIIPTVEPIDVIKQWKLRDIIVSCDLAKAYAELEYFQKHKVLNPLPKIDAKIDFESFDELLFILNSYLDAEYISNDIETVYPRKPSKTCPSSFYKILPGYPITIGLSRDQFSGISFDLFRGKTSETRELWKVLARLLWEVPSIGQNFFNFDANFYEALGFRLPLEKCRDTMIMHHLLWAELPHKLQFLARQYTRHPFWKDEGAGWTIKNMRQMKIYNVKDVVATYEIFLAEQEELKERGLL